MANFIYLKSVFSMVLYVDTLLAFRARAENLGRRARQNLPGSFSLHLSLAAFLADWQARRAQKEYKACHAVVERLR